jgi:hypothetical protein
VEVTGTPVQFHLPIGIPLDFEVHSADVDAGGIRLHGLVQPDAWEYIEGGYLFHLDDARLDDDGGRPPLLEEGKAVDLVLRLADDVLASLPNSARKPDTFVGTLTTTPDDSPLLDTESWFIVEAHQGTNGYRTSFADEATVQRADTDAVPVLEPRVHAESPLMALVLAFLHDMQLDYERYDEHIVRVPIAADEGTYNVFVTVRDEQHQVTFHATWTDEVPEARRPSVMELITRINLDLTVSWFEIDLDHGSVSARSGIDVEGVDATDVIIENAFFAAERTMDRFLPALRAVTFEGLEPSDVPPPTQ